MLYWIAAALAAGSVILDRIVKHAVVAYYAANGLSAGTEIPFLPGFVNICYIGNTGAGFSILEGQRLPLILLTVAVLAFLIWVFAARRVRHPLGVLSLAAVFGGAVGNLIDRILYGEVVDMFLFRFFRIPMPVFQPEFHFVLSDFPIFNVADLFITCGAVALFIYILAFYTRDETLCREEKDSYDHPES